MLIGIYAEIMTTVGTLALAIMTYLTLRVMRSNPFSSDPDNFALSWYLMYLGPWHELVLDRKIYI